jgi:hypothetical protein
MVALLAPNLGEGGLPHGVYAYLADATRNVAETNNTSGLRAQAAMWMLLAEQSGGGRR